MTAFASADTPQVKPALSRTGRIMSLDLMRGLVMVLMAIDHVRVYSGLPAGGPTPGIFFTRWITHFCAPAFVFLAGTAAFLHGRKLADKRALARYLVTRGFILVVLEVTLIRFSWTFNFDYGHFVLAGVIWMLGWCMILLAAFIWLPTWAIGSIGLVIIFFQQVFSVLPRLWPESVRNSVGWIWEFIYPAGLPEPRGISVLYVLVPWIGVMLAGYAFGAIMLRESAERRRLCLRIGLCATALFLLAGGLTVFLIPAPADAPPAIYRFLNQQKYPASQLFLLMTLGPMIALLPLAERAHGRIGEVLSTFGRVPLFYYLLHIPLIHITALVVGLLREGSVHPEWYAQAPFASVPAANRWGLALLYLVFAVDVVVLYFLCRWFAGVKARHPNSWLRYL
ncbi:MAG: heparan-alpha-glucosaminide N-acetyltransferase domain-containing protein [Pyrinomonadaceae bacterium]|nr:heparan-alpha-glucosaminide N-acetyltransferase domain-containing protein [Pyrinomonadaceae bacterium]